MILRALELLPIQEPVAIAENFRRIEEFLRLLGGTTDNHELMAAMWGGEAVTATVAASTATGDDTIIEHDLGRIPSQILLVVDTMGTAGSLYAVAAGGDAASGQNETAWTTDRIYLRSTVSSTYRFVVV